MKRFATTVFCGSLILLLNYSCSVIEHDAANRYFYDGTYNLQIGEYNKAKELFAKALSRDSTVKDIYINRAFIYEREAKYDSAVIDLNNAIKLDSSFTTALYNRGTIYLKIKQFDKAIVDLSKVIFLEPSLLKAYVNRGNAFMAKRQTELAIQDYSKAIQQDKNSSLLLYNRAFAYKTIDEMSKSLIDYKHAISLSPKNPLLHTLAGSIYNNMLIPDSANMYFKNAIYLYHERLKSDSLHAPTLSRVSELYYRTGEFETSIRFAKKSLQSDLTLVFPRYIIALGIFQISDDNNATQLFWEAKQFDDTFRTDLKDYPINELLSLISAGIKETKARKILLEVFQFSIDDN